MAKTKSTDQTGSIKRAQAFLDLVDRVRALGWKGIIDGAMKMLFFAMVVGIFSIAINPRPTLEYIMEITSKIAADQHQALIDKRVENTPTINATLELMSANMNMDRTFIVEFHNGNNNMAALPFWWGDMTYEFVRDDCWGIRDNWMNISLTRYSFLEVLVEHNCWFGSVDLIAEIDDGFAKKLKADDDSFLAFILLYNSDGKPLGILGGSIVEGHDHEIDDAVIMKSLVKYSQIINPLLIGK